MLADVIGVSGVACVLTGYFLLQSGRWSSEEIRFQVINLTGALLILVSLTQNFNLASFVIEICWAGISLYGLARILRTRRIKRRAGLDPSQAGEKAPMCHPDDKDRL